MKVAEPEFKVLSIWQDAGFPTSIFRCDSGSMSGNMLRGCGGRGENSRHRGGNLNTMKIRAIIDILLRGGWFLVSQKGSHRQYYNGRQKAGPRSVSNRGSDVGKQRKTSHGP